MHFIPLGGLPVSATHRIVLCILLLGLIGCGDDDPAGPQGDPTFVFTLERAEGYFSMRGVVRVGEHAYAVFNRANTGNGGGALAVYDIGGLAALDGEVVPPVTVLPLGTNLGGIDEKDGVLFVGGVARSFAIDISDPVSPVVIANVSLPPGTNGVRVGGDQLLLIVGTDLTIHDVTNPRAPVQTHTSLSDCWSGDVRDRRFAMGQLANKRFLLYDVSNAGSFQNYAAATTTVDQAVYHIRWMQSHLYVLIADGASPSNYTMDVYDVSGLAQGGPLVAVDEIELGSNFRAFALSEEFAVAGGLEVYRIFARGADGKLTEVRTVEAPGHGFGDGFPFYGQIQGRVAVMPGMRDGIVIGF